MVGTSDSLVGPTNSISKAANNMQSEVVNQNAENPSENRPLLGKEGRQNISSPVNDGIHGDAANQTANLHEVVQSNDSPITTEPVSVFVQPTSALSGKVADVGSNEEPEQHYCGCDEMYCHCNCGQRQCICGKGPDGYRCVVL